MCIQPVMAVGAKIILRMKNGMNERMKNGMNESILVHEVQQPEKYMYLALPTRTVLRFP